MTVTISEYLDTAGLNAAQFAAILGVDSKTVLRYRNGERTPTPEMMTKIYTHAGGVVTPNDFHELPDLP